MMHPIIGILSAAWAMMLDAGVYILFGILMAGLIKAFGPENRIRRLLGKDNFRSVVWASLIGVPLPLCSCGVLPTAMGLRKQGASKPATLSFLISTPEVGVDSIALTYALLGPVMAIFRPIAAFLTAMAAGLGELWFGKRDYPAGGEKGTDTEPAAGSGIGIPARPWTERLRIGMRFAFVDLLHNMSKWFLLGVLIGGGINYLVPAVVIEQYLGGQWSSMLIMLVVGIPLYICASASTPIAAALLLKGASPGAALVFLLAGPATNAAGITVLLKTLGWRSVVIYLAAISVCALLFGWMLNGIYAAAGIPIIDSLTHTHQIIPPLVQWLVAVPLTVIMVIFTLRSFKKK